MQQAVNRASPTLGMAIGYFAVVSWAIPQGYLSLDHQAEAVAMAGVVATNILMEFRAFLAWMGKFFERKKEE